jgi:hypothetical protein
MSLSTAATATNRKSRFVPPTFQDAVRYDAWPPHNEQMMCAYDWNQSTVQMYKVNNSTTNGEGEGVGGEEERCTTSSLVLPETFRSEREKLDYNYHNLLIYSRLVFQDSIMAQIRGTVTPDAAENGSTVVSTGTAASSSKIDEEKKQEQEEERPPPPLSSRTSHERPWLIFTAGPMGVGKGYVLAQLQQMQVLDISAFIVIDPDMIKTTLPEMAGYDHEQAATLLHAESCSMADVLLEHALHHSYHVLVDGSLRHVEYYQQLLTSRIRREFGHYRIAIIHVTAAAETIRRRAAGRTGRAVPAGLVDASIEQVPRSVEALTPYVDAVHVIRNDDDRDANGGTSGPMLRLEKSIIIQQQRPPPRQQQKQEGNDDAASTPPTMVEIMNPTWEAFAASWQWPQEEEKGHDRGENGRLYYQAHQYRPPSDVAMDDTFHHCTTALHDAAAAIWQRSYPHYCPRCTLGTDRQCGICRHGRHRCACSECVQTTTTMTRLSTV